MLLAILSARPAAGQVTRPAGSSGEEMFQLVGTDEELFVIRTLLPSMMTGEVTVVYRRPVRTGRWRAETQVAGRPSGATIWRGQLVLRMEDGTWRPCFEGGSTLGPAIPGGEEVIVLAGEGERLFAVTRSGTQMRVMELQGATWVGAGPTPTGLVVTSALMSNGKLEVLGRAAEGGQPIELFEGTLATGTPTTVPATRGMTRPATRPVNITWSHVAALPPAPRAALVDVRGDLGVWERGDDEVGGLLLRSAGFDPAKRIDLGNKRGALGVAAGRIRVVYRESNGDVLEQAYDTMGKKVGKPEPLAIVSGPDDRLESVVNGLAIAGAMAAVLLAWKRRSELTPAEVSAAGALPVATVVSRMSATLIDVIPFLAVAAYLFIGERQTLAEMTATPRSVYLLLVGAAAVSLHTLVGELIFGGRSIGKALMGTRVVGMNGASAPPAQVLARCLFKLPLMIGMLLPVLWLSLVVSPLRQGMWDAASGTLVIRGEPRKQGSAGDDK